MHYLATKMVLQVIKTELLETKILLLETAMVLQAA
jgi:hypothetical protein